MSVIRKPLAFLKRDLRTEVSYRLAFPLQVVMSLLSIAPYYFLGRFVGERLVPGIDGQREDYFAFVLIGVALHDFLSTSLDAFARSIRESQLTGTLEAVLGTQTSLFTVILSSAIYPFLWTSFTVVLYLGFGVWPLGARLDFGNWAPAILILALAVIVFSSLGILSASFILVWKRGSPITWMFGALSWLLGGVLYPVTVLPDWLQIASALLPITYAIEGMRGALLLGAPWSALWGNLGPLALFAAAAFPLSLLSFRYAASRAKISGSLGHY